jgi:adenylate cyclase
VLAAIDLFAALEQFNRPRRVLALQPFQIRIGIATGYVWFGNVGTYQKVDFTAVGRTTNLAARLQKYSRDGHPCVSKETHDRAGRYFAWEGPETVRADGFTDQEVWFPTAANSDQAI